MSYLFDTICLVILVGSPCLGYRRGFFPELLDEIALLIGIVAAGFIHYTGWQLPGPWVTPGLIASLAQFAFIMMTATLGIRLLARKLHKAVDGLLLKPLNRFGGASLALVKAWVIIGGFVLLLVRFPVLPLDWLNRSIFAPLMLFAGRTVSILLPADFADALHAMISAVSGT